MGRRAASAGYPRLRDNNTEGMGSSQRVCHSDLSNRPSRNQTAGCERKLAYRRVRT